MCCFLQNICSLDHGILTQRTFVLGFIDVSLTLYDITTCQFQVAAGPGCSVPSSDYLRLAYVANVAVDQRFRRCSHPDQLSSEMAAADTPPKTTATAYTLSQEMKRGEEAEPDEAGGVTPQRSYQPRVQGTPPTPRPASR